MHVERLERRALLATVEVYSENFESGDGGYVADNTGGSVLGLWHYSIGRRHDGLPNHTPDHNWYYGAFETSTGGGRYDVLPFDHQGTITSPAIQIPSCGASSLSFSYVLNTRPELDRDFAEVFVVDDSGQALILSRAGGSLPQSGYDQWLTATADLSAFAGEQIHLVFSFRTGTPPQVDPEGWYVDDVLITNNTDSCPPPVFADLSVIKTVDDATPNELQTVVYTITAANSSTLTATATGVVVEDNLPAGVTFVSATASQGSYNPATDLWTGIALPPGASATLTITATVNPGTGGGPCLPNIARIGDPSVTDPTSNNDTSRVDLCVNPPLSVDLSVAKTIDDATPDAGQPVVYTITAANASASNAAAPGVIITDNLPAGVTFVSAIAEEGAYDPATDRWNGLDLAPGETRKLTIFATVNAGAGGSVLINTATIGPGPGTDPNTANNQATAMAVINSLVQFITPMSLFRLGGPFAPPAPVVVGPPAAGTATIKGFKWHDLDQDGMWDTGEPARPGWNVFLDLNGNNRFDPLTEPFSVTATDGSYVFTNLSPGTYFVREDRAQLSAGTFQVQKFPGADPAGQRDPDEHCVQVIASGTPSSNASCITIVAGQVLQGSPGVAEAPNFGSFEYSPFIRPADNFPGRFAAFPAERASYLSAASPWQSFDVSNTTGRPLQITAINKLVDTTLIGAASQFVTVFQRAADGSLVAPSFPVSLPAGASVEFFAFYDPAIRSGDVVNEQYPDWFDKPDTAANEGTTRTPHSFATSDRLEVVTAFTDSAPSAGPTFVAKLLGGSTYDSDIFYDASVDGLDLGRMSDDIIARQWPAQAGASGSLFEPTSDINARHPNGAGGVVGTPWSLSGPPAREIALGDFGTLNVEFSRARAPWLDLDPDNSSGATGNGFNVRFDGIAVPIADFDARLGNSDELELNQIVLTIANPVDGAAEGLTTPANPTPSASITISGAGKTLEAVVAELRAVRYVNSARTPGVRQIQVSTTGGVKYQLIFNQTVGNVATVNVLVTPAPGPSPSSLPEGEGESAPLAQAAQGWEAAAGSDRAAAPTLLVGGDEALPRETAWYERPRGPATAVRPLDASPQPAPFASASGDLQAAAAPAPGAESCDASSAVLASPEPMDLLALDYLYALIGMGELEKF